MTQVASYQVPAHPSGLDMRTQLNAIVLALVGDNSGPTAPTVTYPGMMWGDTTANRLKRRTNANDAWIDLGPIDNFLADVTATANNKVSKTGDTMTGALTLSNTGTLSSVLYLKAGSYAPHFRAASDMPGFQWINGANNAVPMTLTDTGSLGIAGALTAGTGVIINGYGSLQLAGAAGRAYLRADASMTNGYGGGGLGSGMINNANNAWNFQMSDNGNWSLRGFTWNDLQRVGNNGDANGYRSWILSGAIKQSEYNYGPYHDFNRAGSEDFKWRIHYNFNNNYMEFLCNGAGNVQFANDGNIYSSSQGWFSDKAPKVNCQWNSGITETGPIYGGNYDAYQPQVLAGVRGGTGQSTANFIFIRFLYLRDF
ncbi:hypothetical protein [Caballeronia zhejiangensis]|uniref:hypothetical protein n=1 Tax=Caballeronia zhejiangensis TaxID=871203 RepID=UPI001EF4D2A8|nr:hypothetical protein [Caballeronia zhejiangensis]MCG7403003.1 hypothetical protein [Caballeronia zhejiangensis]